MYKYLIAGGVGVVIISLLKKKTQAQTVAVEEPYAPNDSYVDNRYPIITAPGVEYQTTDADWLWIARSANCETRAIREQYIAVIWAELQRFVYFRQKPTPPFSELWRMVRSFSQPVNPIWMDLDACRNGRGCCGNTVKCSARKLAHRAACSSRSWDWFATNRVLLMEVLHAFIVGPYPPNPIPGYADFGSYPAVCNRADATNIGGNCFIPTDPPVQGPVVLV